MFIELCQKNRPDCMKNILVLGATSSIAQAYCRLCAPVDARFWLVGRNADRLHIVADDLKARGAGVVDYRTFTPGDYAGLAEAIEGCFAAWGRVDVFLAAQGALPSQEDCEREPARLTEFFQGSAIEVMQAALQVASRFEAQGDGTCVILGSVAGDRGRRGNYVYGSAKAALDTFCDGLRQRLAPRCRVILVKPGPVNTPMTAHLEKTALFTTSDKVASAIDAAIKRSGVAVVYAPGYWRWIMFVVKRLPAGVVQRMRA
jgi:decaprenylphospho-beta-D-erythro-pentofuranosid-2-ulose 2-reductase